jgi:hypothetical protein
MAGRDEPLSHPPADREPASVPGGQRQASPRATLVRIRRMRLDLLFLMAIFA